MNDVPTVDYHKMYQEIIEEDMLAVASSKIRDALLCKELRPLILNGMYTVTCRGANFDGVNYHARHVGISSVAIYNGYIVSEGVHVKSHDVIIAAAKHHVDNQALREKIASAIGGCSTVKMATERMPELAKYLPEEPVVGKLLPAIFDLAADLAKAGWPKGAVAA